MFERKMEENRLSERAQAVRLVPGETEFEANSIKVERVIMPCGVWGDALGSAARDSTHQIPKQGEDLPGVSEGPASPASPNGRSGVLPHPCGC